MRTNPILTLGMVAGALAFPGRRGALGLGKLTVESVAGPAAVGADRTRVPRPRTSSIRWRCKIADPTLYRQNNLAYNSVLARARVTLERRPAAQPYLKVVTPVRGQRAVPRPDGRAELGLGSPRSRIHVPARSARASAPTPVEPVAPVRVGAAPPRARRRARSRAAPRTRPRRRPRRRAAPAPRAVAARRSRTRCKRGDTLSKIASEYKPPAVTLEQMLVALFNTNQDAFDGNNINRLRAGAIVDHPQRRRRRRNVGPRKPRRSSGCRRPTGARTAIASRRPRPTSEAAAGASARRQDRHRSRRERRRRRRPDATSSRCRGTRAPARARQRHRGNDCPRARRSRKRSSASPSSRRR